MDPGRLFGLLGLLLAFLRSADNLTGLGLTLDEDAVERYTVRG